MVVKQEMEKLNLKTVHVGMGEVELQKPLTKRQEEELNDRLKIFGFELLNNQKQKLIEQVKTLLIHKIQKDEIEEHFGIAKFLGKRLLKDYSSVSRLFSEVEGITIEQFVILQKIEKAKELLVYGELTLSEIAWKLGYSSVAHLSSQFKKITGLTPSHFKKMGGQRRSLDEV
ncbi:MAG: AraC family transcriptional regulator [Ferruginibacter sp.]